MQVRDLVTRLGIKDAAHCVQVWPWDMAETGRTRASWADAVSWYQAQLREPLVCDHCGREHKTWEGSYECRRRALRLPCGVCLLRDAPSRRDSFQGEPGVFRGRVGALWAVAFNLVTLSCMTEGRVLQEDRANHLLKKWCGIVRNIKGLQP